MPASERNPDPYGLDEDYPDDRHIGGLLTYGDASLDRRIVTADVGMELRVGVSITT